MKNVILVTLYLSLFGFLGSGIDSENDLLLKDKSMEADILLDQAQDLEFNTDGLYYAEFFDYIFRGHFENVEVTRDNMEFLLIFESYLRTFGRNCSQYLPKDKVDIMDLQCVTENVTRNGYGIEVNRYCVEWVPIKSGLSARPELYDAKMQIERKQTSEGLGTAIKMMADPNAAGNSVDLIHKSKGLQNDMAQIFQINPCNSPGVRRFEENLRLYALNQPSIRMQGESKYAAMKNTGGPSGPQDFDKLVDDLVNDQSRTWAFNRYIPGSINGLIIQSKDNVGRPAEIKANYSYKGFGGNSNGWVRVTFINGLPECIYFFDYPNNCKDAGRSIVASYANGHYKGR